MRLLKTSESLARLLSGFENEGKRIEAYKDINNNWVFPESIKTISWLSAYIPQMELIESEIDHDLTQAAWEKERIIHAIDSIVQTGIAKPTEAIDYKIELTQKLHAKRELQKTGFVTPVTWYRDYDGNEYAAEVLRVDVTYHTDESDPIPAAQTVLYRDTVRRWKTTDGQYGAQKVTRKYYPTLAEQRAEGRRRRGNILTLVEQGVSERLYVAGYSPEQIKSMLSSFTSKHSAVISTYLEGGIDPIYTDIDNDQDTEWLTAELKDYIIKTLKGL
jgi:hypothetical protein